MLVVDAVPVFTYSQWAIFFCAGHLEDADFHIVENKTVEEKPSFLSIVHNSCLSLCRKFWAPPTCTVRRTTSFWCMKHWRKAADVLSFCQSFAFFAGGKLEADGEVLPRVIKLSARDSQSATKVTSGAQL